MLIIPAIDIRKGKVVRLTKGDFSKETIYSERPEDIAYIWQKEGARMLHVVDLDGALSGKMENLDSIRAILRRVDIPIQVGGGIRNYEDIKKLISLGIKRVILSTAACEDRRLLNKAILDFQDKIIVSVDVKDDEVMIRGWMKSSHLKAIDFTNELEALGVKTLIYTDIKSDGTLGGVDIKKIQDFLNRTNLSVIVSGGISTIKDIKDLKNLEGYGLEGVIIGKALYDRKISLKEAQSI